MPLTATLAFGPLLKYLRKQAGMTQRDLAAALGYSESLICSLEKAQRLPDLQAVTERFIPALGLQDDPAAATTLIEQAARARGQRVPVAVTFQRITQMVVQAEFAEATAHLPSPPTALIGRAAELNQLCNRLLGHGGRLLTLVGPPGIGKTTLALAVAERLHPHYTDGAVFVSLAAINESTSMATTMATTVGCSDASPKPPKTKLIEFLRRKTMLLVLDNLEQIREAAPLIAELVAECPGLFVLATSRERLHLRAEQRFKVPPLELAAAVELFIKCAQAVDADFCLTPHNQATIEAICQQLDCLPLALELCAAQIDLFSPAQLLTQLQQRRLDVLVDGAHDLPPRQRTLRTAIQHSYLLLGEEERTLFRNLGVFVSGFDLEAGAAVYNERVETREWRLNHDTPSESLSSSLHSLIGKSLVRSETTADGEVRFFLLETIREFALEQLKAHGEEAQLRQRHYAVYLQRFRTGNSYLRGPEAMSWLARLKPEQDNLRAALHWVLTTERYADAAWLMMVANYFWVLCGYGYEDARWLAQLLPYRQVFTADLRLAFLLTFYRAAFALEEFQPLDELMAEIMVLQAHCAHRSMQGTAWALRAWTIADGAQAAATWEHGIALARAAKLSPALDSQFGALADYDFVLAAHLWGYATFLTAQGKVARAIPIAAESLQLFHTRGNRSGIGDSLGTLGRLALLQGDLPNAQKYFQEVVAMATTIGYTGMQSEWQALLALTTLYGGDAGEARRLLMASLRRCLEQKHTILLGQVCTYLTEVALWEGALAEAEHWLAQSLTYHADPRRITIEEVQRLWVAARLATAQQQYQRAAMLFGLTEQIHHQVHDVIAGPLRALAAATLATVRAALETTVFVEAFATGQRMTLEEAFTTLLAPPAVAPQSQALE